MQIFLSLVVALQIFGAYLNVKRRHECFMIFTFTNLIFLLYNFSQGEIAEGILWSVFLCISIYGLFSWRKKEEKEKIIVVGIKANEVNLNGDYFSEEVLKEAAERHNRKNDE